jgi:site-specific DNA recombinase
MNVGIIYTRVSTKEQAENKTSLDSQEKECLAFARKHNAAIPIENIFRERGESAKFVDRPELQRLLQFVKENKGKVGTLYIWKIDRLARNLGDYYGIKVALAKYNVKIVSVTEPIEDDPVGRFLEAILAAAAQFDNEIRAIRTVTGMRVRVEQGKWPHSAPIGYKKIRGRVVSDPEYASKITDVLLKFSTGSYSLAEIARHAFSQGIQTSSGRPKSTDAMKKILQNLIYAGYTRNKLSTKVHKGLHKPLVDEEIVYKNIDIIAGNKKTYTLRGDDLFPLRGTLLCSNCGHTLTASSPKGRSGYYPLYHCNQPTCKKKVTGRKASGDADIAHKNFREALALLRPLDGLSKLFKEIVLRAWNDEYGQAVENAERIQREIGHLRKLRQATNEKFILDKITEEDKNAQVATIAQKIEDLQDELVEVDQYIQEKEQIVDDAMSFINTPDIFWNRANTKVRQDIQLLLFPNGIAYDFETGFGTAEKIKSYLLIDELSKDNAKNSDLVTSRGIEPRLPG